MIYRIEQDDSSKRESFEPHTYRIYQDDRLIARYWHDFRGDEHGIEFVNGVSEDWPVGRMIDFISGGGPESLLLSEQAVAYLNKRSQSDT